MTGANGGIGREVCLELAKRGANVVLACRTMNKRTENLPQFLHKKFPNSQFELQHLDLGSFASIRKFAEEIGMCREWGTIVYTSPSCITVKC